MPDQGRTHAQPKPAAAPAPAGSANLTVPVEKIKANPWQPRRAFEKEALSGTAASILRRNHPIRFSLRISGTVTS